MNIKKVIKEELWECFWEGANVRPFWKKSEEKTNDNPAGVALVQSDVGKVHYDALAKISVC